MATELQQPHPYEPKCKAFVLETLCRAVALAKRWDGVLSGAEAIANALRIAREIEGEAFRTDFSAAAAEQRRQSLDQIRELGREIRESQNGGVDGAVNS